MTNVSSSRAEKTGRVIWKATSCLSTFLAQSSTPSSSVRTTLVHIWSLRLPAPSLSSLPGILQAQAFALPKPMVSKIMVITHKGGPPWSRKGNADLISGLKIRCIGSPATFSTQLYGYIIAPEKVAGHGYENRRLQMPLARRRKDQEARKATH